MALTLSQKCISSKRACSTQYRASSVVCRAQPVDRRQLLGLIAVGAPLIASAPAFAAYGDSANIFARKATNTSGFVPYSSAGEFAVLLPSKWNPSKEREFPNTVLRYEDNYFPVNNFTVIKEKAAGGNIEAYGPPEKFLEKVQYLLGKQSYSGETQSEGGFAPNRVSAASILDISSGTDKKGKTYYAYDILTRTGDGNEGGRRQLIKATVSDGNLWIVKVQAGDKRWVKGTNKECQGIIESFTVA